MDLKRITYENLRSGTNTGLLVLRADLAPGERSPSEIAQFILSQTDRYNPRVPFYLPLTASIEQSYEDELESMFSLLSEKRKTIARTGGIVLFKWYRHLTWIICEATTSTYSGVFSNELHLQLRDIDEELPFTPEGTQRFIDISFLTTPEEGFRFIGNALQDWRILTASRELYRKGIYDIKETKE